MSEVIQGEGREETVKLQESLKRPECNAARDMMYYIRHRYKLKLDVPNPYYTLILSYLESVARLTT